MVFFVTRSYSTLKNSCSKPKVITTPAALYPDAYLNKSMIVKDNKNKAGVYR